MAIQTRGDDAEEEARLQLEVAVERHLLALIRQLGQPSELELPVPAVLRAELRSYQHQGFTWLSLSAEIRAWRLFG